MSTPFTPSKEPSTKRQLIVFTDNFPFGGGETFFEAELDRLVSAFDVTVISSSTSDHQTRSVPFGVNVLRYNPRHARLSGSEKLATLIRMMGSRFGPAEVGSILRTHTRIIDRLKVSLSAFAMSRRLYTYVQQTIGLTSSSEVILYFYWFNYKPIYFALKLANTKVKLVSRVHGYDLYNERQASGRHPFRHLVDARLNNVLFVSKTGMDYYLNTFAITPSFKHQVLYLGTRKPPVLPSPASGKDWVIVSCSNVIELKRIDRIVESLAALDVSDRHLNWIHFGDGPLLDAITQQAHALLDAKPNVTFELRGAIRNADLMQFYQTHPVDCFITLSSTEGIPVSIMEAMSYGIVVLATDVGGIKEMLPADYPYVVDPSVSAAQVASLIQTLMDLAPAQRAALSQALIDQWATHFNEETNAMKLIACLNER